MVRKNSQDEDRTSRRSFLGSLTKWTAALGLGAIYAVNGNTKRPEILLAENGLRPQGYWKDFGNVEREAREAMRRHNWDTMPSVSELREQGYDNLTRAVNKYHGGFSEIRKKLKGQNDFQNTNWSSINGGAV